MLLAALLALLLVGGAAYLLLKDKDSKGSTNTQENPVGGSGGSGAGDNVITIDNRPGARADSSSISGLKVGEAAVWLSFEPRPGSAKPKAFELADKYQVPARIDLTLSERIPHSRYAVLFSFPGLSPDQFDALTPTCEIHRQNEIVNSFALNLKEPDLSVEFDSTGHALNCAIRPIDSVSGLFYLVLEAKNPDWHFGSTANPELFSDATVFIKTGLAGTDAQEGLRVALTAWDHPCKTQVVDSADSEKTLESVVVCRDAKLGFAVLDDAVRIFDERATAVGELNAWRAQMVLRDASVVTEASVQPVLFADSDAFKDIVEPVLAQSDFVAVASTEKPCGAMDLKCKQSRLNNPEELYLRPWPRSETGGSTVSDGRAKLNGYSFVLLEREMDRLKRVIAKADASLLGTGALKARLLAGKTRWAQLNDLLQKRVVLSRIPFSPDAQQNEAGILSQVLETPAQADTQLAKRKRQYKSDAEVKAALEIAKTNHQAVFDATNRSDTQPFFERYYSQQSNPPDGSNLPETVQRKMLSAVRNAAYAAWSSSESQNGLANSLVVEENINGQKTVVSSALHDETLSAEARKQLWLINHRVFDRAEADILFDFIRPLEIERDRLFAAEYGLSKSADQLQIKMANAQCVIDAMQDGSHSPTPDEIASSADVCLSADEGTARMSALRSRARRANLERVGLEKIIDAFYDGKDVLASLGLQDKTLGGANEPSASGGSTVPFEYSAWLKGSVSAKAEIRWNPVKTRSANSQDINGDSNNSTASNGSSGAPTVSYVVWQAKPDAVKRFGNLSRVSEADLLVHFVPVVETAQTQSTISSASNRPVLSGSRFVVEAFEKPFNSGVSAGSSASAADLAKAANPAERNSRKPIARSIVLALSEKDARFGFVAQDPARLFVENPRATFAPSADAIAARENPVFHFALSRLLSLRAKGEDLSPTEKQRALFAMGRHHLSMGLFSEALDEFSACQQIKDADKDLAGSCGKPAVAILGPTVGGQPAGFRNALYPNHSLIPYVLSNPIVNREKEVVAAAANQSLSTVPARSRLMELLQELPLDASAPPESKKLSDWPWDRGSASIRPTMAAVVDRPFDDLALAYASNDPVKEVLGSIPGVMAPPAKPVVPEVAPDPLIPPDGTANAQAPKSFRGFFSLSDSTGEAPETTDPTALGNPAPLLSSGSSVFPMARFPEVARLSPLEVLWADNQWKKSRSSELFGVNVSPKKPRLVYPAQAPSCDTTADVCFLPNTGFFENTLSPDSPPEAKEAWAADAFISQNEYAPELPDPARLPDQSYPLYDQELGDLRTAFESQPSPANDWTPESFGEFIQKKFGYSAAEAAYKAGLFFLDPPPRVVEPTDLGVVEDPKKTLADCPDACSFVVRLDARQNPLGVNILGSGMPADELYGLNAAGILNINDQPKRIVGVLLFPGLRDAAKWHRVEPGASPFQQSLPWGANAGVYVFSVPQDFGEILLRIKDLSQNTGSKPTIDVTSENARLFVQSPLPVPVGVGLIPNWANLPAFTDADAQTTTQLAAQTNSTGACAGKNCPTNPTLACPNGSCAGVTPQTGTDTAVAECAGGSCEQKKNMNPSDAQSAAAGSLAHTEQEIHSLVNVRRGDVGTGSLEYDSLLSDIARAHSEKLLAPGTWETVFKPDEAAGSMAHAGIQDRLEEGQCISGGENIHLQRGLNEVSNRTINGWMASDGHRANLLRADWMVEGLGVATKGDRVVVTQLLCVKAPNSISFPVVVENVGDSGLDARRVLGASETDLTLALEQSVLARINGERSNRGLASLSYAEPFSYVGFHHSVNLIYQSDRVSESGFYERATQARIMAEEKNPCGTLIGPFITRTPNEIPVRIPVNEQLTIDQARERVVRSIADRAFNSGSFTSSQARYHGLGIVSNHLENELILTYAYC